MNAVELGRTRALFPVLSNSIYFNHASTGPLPLTGVEAVTGYCRYQAETGQVPYDEAEAAVEEARQMLARLLRVAPETVAFTKNTSAGVTIAIGSTEWREGDNVVLMEDDFPTVTYPFHFLLPGVQKRWLSSERLAEGPEAVSSLVDDRTRMVAVSWVHFLTGRRFDIAAICRFCRERGVVTVIDAIQGIGVVDCDWDAVGADFVVSHGAKWLLSPQGSGFLRVRPEILPTLRPCNMGWLSAEWRDFNDILTVKPMKAGASRFEEGTKNYLAIYGLRESLRIFLAAGPAAVEARVRQLCARLRRRLEELGFEIATPAEAERNAGIVTGARPGDDSGLLHRRLSDAKMVCSLRENQLRIAPHFYNTEEEVDRFTELLAAPAGKAAKPAACPM